MHTSTHNPRDPRSHSDAYVSFRVRAENAGVIYFDPNAFVSL